MEFFSYKNGRLFCEEVDLESLAHEVGTPFYCYSLGHIRSRFSKYQKGFGDQSHIICYAVKANSNLSILHCLSKMGAGADIVSGGELFRALRAGIDPKKIVYSGVGKTRQEIRFALESGILMLNVESIAELETIVQIASEMNKVAPISLRVNPDVDPKTHPYISTGLKKNKFGLEIQQAKEAYLWASKNKWLEIKGIDCHIGSQILDIQPFKDAVARVITLVDHLGEHGIEIKYLDIGGGLGIKYKDEDPPEPDQYVAEILTALGTREMTIIVEPGRSIVGNAGALVTSILYFKDNTHKKFYIVDGAMNDLGRPSLYDAYHTIMPVRLVDEGEEVEVDIVGPICETGDFLAKDRSMPLMKAGELLAVMNAGAYGFSMSSNYNSRPRVPEILIDGNSFFVARRRETYEDLIRLEEIVPNC